MQRNTNFSLVYKCLEVTRIFKKKMKCQFDKRELDQFFPEKQKLKS